MQQITIIKPDDWHLHLRDNKIMENVVNFSAKQMSRALIMPNLDPPITTTKLALSYKKRILAAVNGNFMPFMTLYLTDNTNTDEVKTAKENNILGFKLYPAGSTTNSNYGVSDIKNIYPVLAQMQKLDMVLLVHGEETNKNIDIFDREKIFITNTLVKLIQDFPDLRIVFEHITTKDSVDFVLSCNNNIAATITPHHLYCNRNDMFIGGIRPHYYCLPILKKSYHQQALIQAAISGNKKFFLGTDSAPHSKKHKESSCGCAGIFNAPIAIEIYTQVFDTYNALDKLEDFCAKFGAKFYKLSYNKEKITLIKKKLHIKNIIIINDESIVPFMFNSIIDWKLVY